MRAGEEGVGSALASHSGFRSMPAVHDGRIRERKQLALDALQERLEVAAGQVGPPDRALEQHVPGERHTVSLEHDAARRMARGVAHVELERAHPQQVAVGERAIGRGERSGAHAEGTRLLRHVVVQQPVARVEVHGRAGVGLEPGNAEHVVDVSMSQPNRHGFHARIRNLVGDQARLLARIDDGAFAAGFIDDEIAVFDELAVRDRHDFHEAVPAFSRSRKAARYFSTAIAAVVASPTAVVIWRVSWLRTSPATNSPGIEVIIRSSVMKYPPASCLACPSTSPELGLKPTKMNTPPTARVTRPPVAVSSRTR